MKINPIFFNKNNGFSNKGYFATSSKSVNKINYNNQTDVFVRLAMASMRDVKIENELKTMGLI